HTTPSGNEFLAHLRAGERFTFKFAFGLEPIVQLTGRLFTPFEMNFLCAKSNFLVTRHVPHADLCNDAKGVTEMLHERRERRGIAGPSVHKYDGFWAATRFPIATSGALYTCNIHDANLFSLQPSHSMRSWFS